MRRVFVEVDPYENQEPGDNIGHRATPKMYRCTECQALLFARQVDNHECSPPNEWALTDESAGYAWPGRSRQRG